MRRAYRLAFLLRGSVHANRLHHRPARGLHDSPAHLRRLIAAELDVIERTCGGDLSDLVERLVHKQPHHPYAPAAHRIENAQRLLTRDEALAPGVEHQADKVGPCLNCRSGMLTLPYATDLHAR